MDTNKKSTEKSDSFYFLHHHADRSGWIKGLFSEIEVLWDALIAIVCEIGRSVIVFQSVSFYLYVNLIYTGYWFAITVSSSYHVSFLVKSSFFLFLIINEQWLLHNSASLRETSLFDVVPLSLSCLSPL